MSSKTLHIKVGTYSWFEPTTGTGKRQTLKTNRVFSRISRHAKPTFINTISWSLCRNEPRLHLARVQTHIQLLFITNMSVHNRRGPCSSNVSLPSPILFKIFFAQAVSNWTASRSPSSLGCIDFLSVPKYAEVRSNLIPLLLYFLAISNERTREGKTLESNISGLNFAS